MDSPGGGWNGARARLWERVDRAPRTAGGGPGPVGGAGEGGYGPDAPPAGSGAKGQAEANTRL